MIGIELGDVLFLEWHAPEFPQERRIHKVFSCCHIKMSIRLIQFDICGANTRNIISGELLSFLVHLDYPIAQVMGDKNIALAVNFHPVWSEPDRRLCRASHQIAHSDENTAVADASIFRNVKAENAVCIMFAHQQRLSIANNGYPIRKMNIVCHFGKRRSARRTVENTPTILGLATKGPDVVR